MDKRIIYNTGNVQVNGILIHGLKAVGMATNFELEQCFCSCSVRMDVHRDDCPNAEKERFVRYLTEEEINALG